MTDWEKIRTGFVKDGLSYRALSREFAAPYSTIQRRASRRTGPGSGRSTSKKTSGKR